MKAKTKGLLAELYNTKDLKEGLTSVRWAQRAAKPRLGPAASPRGHRLLLFTAWNRSQRGCEVVGMLTA